MANGTHWLQRVKHIVINEQKKGEKKKTKILNNHKIVVLLKDAFTRKYICKKTKQNKRQNKQTNKTKKKPELVQVLIIFFWVMKRGSKLKLFLSPHTIVQYDK